MTESIWLAVVPVITTLMLTFFGAVGAVWAILSKRISALQLAFDKQGEMLMTTSHDKAKAEAERDLAKERSADLKQRLTVAGLEVSEYKSLLAQALDMRSAIEETAALRLQVASLTRLVEDRRAT